MQVHEATSVAFDLTGVQEASGELHAVADIRTATSPFPAGGRQLLARLVTRVAAAVRYVPPAARRRHGVRDARTGDGVREGRLATACRYTVNTSVLGIQPTRTALHFWT